MADATALPLLTLVSTYAEQKIGTRPIISRRDSLNQPKSNTLSLLPLPQKELPQQVRQLFLCLKGLESAALIVREGPVWTGDYGAVTILK